MKKKCFNKYPSCIPMLKTNFKYNLIICSNIKVLLRCIVDVQNVVLFTVRLSYNVISSCIAFIVSALEFSFQRHTFIYFTGFLGRVQSRSGQNLKEIIRRLIRYIFQSTLSIHFSFFSCRYLFLHSRHLRGPQVLPSCPSVL